MSNGSFGHNIAFNVWCWCCLVGRQAEAAAVEENKFASSQATLSTDARVATITAFSQAAAVLAPRKAAHRVLPFTCFTTQTTGCLLKKVLRPLSLLRKPSEAFFVLFGLFPIEAVMAFSSSQRPSDDDEYLFNNTMRMSFALSGS